MADRPANDASPPRVSILRCMVCGNTVECKPADLMRMTRTGWLRCCGEVMTLFTPADPSGPPPAPRS
ncbi:MAG TPA: hypothetical protein VGF55_11725 [Gemmataceae bacterium]|jgi:hypothetical protein